MYLIHFLSLTHFLEILRQQKIIKLCKNSKMILLKLQNEVKNVKNGKVGKYFNRIFAIQSTHLVSFIVLSVILYNLFLYT